MHHILGEASEKSDLQRCAGHKAETDSLVKIA